MKKSIFLKLTTFLMAFAVLAACGDDGKDTGKDDGKDPGGTDPTFESAITIDGNYADWQALEADNVSIFISENTTATNSQLKVLKAYLDEEFLSIYVEFDGTVPQAHFQLFIDEDNDVTTGTVGLDYLFTNSGIEAMFEGPLRDEANTAYQAYDAGIFFPDLEIEDTWQWNETADIGTGAGVIESSIPKVVSGTTYAFEFQVAKSMLELSWGNTISIGVGAMDAGWARTGALPCANDGTAADMLAVKFTKTLEE